MYDVVLVGGGVSSLSVLVRLAQRRALAPGARVALVDANGETGGGAAYARGVHPALLLNDRVSKIDRTGLGFGRWLVENAAPVLADLEQWADHRVRRWIGEYGRQLAQGDVADLYVPRAVFGVFARRRFELARRRLREQGVTVEVLTAVLRDMSRTAAGWRLDLQDAHAIDAVSVVLGIGGPVARAGATHRRHIIGRPGLDLMAVEAAVSQVAGADVLLLGTAASAVEIVYCLEADPRLCAAFRRIVTISSSGRLPDGVSSGSTAAFVPLALLEGPDSADALLADLERDVRAARELGLRMPDVYPALHEAFATRVRRMSDAERKRVTDVHIPTYLALTRKTSTVYSDGAARLLSRGQLEHVTGRVRDVHAGADAVEVTLHDGRTVRGAVALDCRGFGSPAADPLLARLIDARVLQQNDSTLAGIRVDAGLQAAPAVVVLGPLLAGTARAGDHIWHLEDIPRIYALAEEVVDTLEQVLARHREVADLVRAG